MLQNLIARYRVWQLRLDTTRYLQDFDDRLLADMGIERAAIKTIARRSAKAQGDVVTNSVCQPKIKLTR